MIVADNTIRFMGRVHDEALKRLKKAADLVADRARINVPVDTGALKQSIHVDIHDKDELIARIIADSLRKTPAKSGPISYAWYVETGEGTGPAQPYMRPALHSSLDNIERLFS